jgi:hypothetical protein
MRNPDLYRKQNSEFSADKLFDAIKPVDVELPGGRKGYKDPNRPGVISEYGIEEYGAQPGAGGGRVDTYPVSPTRVAGMNAAAGRTGGAPIIDDGGQVARADMGAPVNAMTAGQQRQQPPVAVGNAMVAPSPYGELVQPQAARTPAVVGSGEFARRAEEAKLQEGVRKVGLETKAREEAKLNVAKPEAERVQEIAKEGFATTLSNMATQIQELGQKGMLVKPGETNFSNRVKAGLSDVSPRLTTMLSPERGENVSTYANLRLSLLTALMDVTGKTSSQINSDKELKINLDALSSPGQTVKTITDTMNNLSKQYGSGKKYKEEDFTGGVVQNPPSEVPTRRKAAAQPVAVTTAPGTEGAGRGISKTEYDALPSGSVYTAPNGEQRTKR